MKCFSEFYLVYMVDKVKNNRGTHECGLYEVVRIETNEEETVVDRESKAIKEWQKQVGCCNLNYSLVGEAKNKPAWVIIDEADNNKEYYIVVKYLPKELEGQRGNI